MISRGIVTPITTQISRHGRVDRKAMSLHSEWLYRSGVTSLLVLGSLGEAIWISDAHCKEVMTWAAENLRGRRSFWMGLPARKRTKDTLRYVEMAAKTGAEAILISPPKGELGPDIRFFREVASSGIPIILYNFPTRTGHDVGVEYLQALLKEVPDLAGLKQSSSSVMALENAIIGLKPIRPSFAIFTGWDHLLLSQAVLGGDGVVSTISNFAPELPVSLRKLLEENGNWQSIADLYSAIVSTEFSLGVSPNFVSYVSLVKRVLSARCKKFSPRLACDKEIVSTKAEGKAFSDILATIERVSANSREPITLA